MKVLHVIDGLGTGGAERSLAEALPGFEAAGIESVIAVRRDRTEGVEHELVKAGADVRRIGGGRLPGEVRSLRALIRAEGPALVHSTLFGATLVARCATVRSGVPLLTSLVNTPYEEVRVASDPNVRRRSLRVVRGVDRATAPMTAHFHAITRAVRDSAVARLHIAPERVTVIERGRDSARLGRPSAARRKAARSALGLAADAHVVLNVARREFQKGQVHLLDAAAKLVADDPSLVVLIAGRDGNASAELRSRHEELALGDRVRFLGHSDQVPDLLAAADVFVFPSLWEGLGGSLVEAMAMGLPIVASDVPAIAETVVAGENALLVPPGQPTELAGALRALLADAPRRRSFGRVSRQRFDEHYTLDRSTARMVDLYRRTAR